MTIFTDTSAILALLDRSERRHQQAAAVWKEILLSGEDPVTSNYILVESMALIQNRLGLPAVRVFAGSLLPVIEVLWVNESVHQAATAALLMEGRRKLSLVDCVSFHLMRHCGIETAFCFDKHFREQGFRTLP